MRDRLYVASSFLSVAIAQVFRTALQGRCDLKPDLVTTAIPLDEIVGSPTQMALFNL